MMLFMTMDGDSISEPPITNSEIKRVLVSGDSTIDWESCRVEPNTIASLLFTEVEKANGYEAVNIARQGNKILGQKIWWDNRPDKQTFDAIIVQIGLNDMTNPTATILSDYQTYVDAINAGKRADAKLFISCMLPARGRLYSLGGQAAQDNWITLNESIMGRGATPILNVDKRNEYHVALMAGTNGILAPQYDCGDGIHENQAGADIIIAGFRSMIFS